VKLSDNSEQECLGGNDFMETSADVYSVWVHLAVQGDRTALDKLLLHHFDELMAHITARLPDQLRPVVNVDDLLQETFLRAIRGVRKFEVRDADAFGGWLKVIAERQIQTAVTLRMARKRSGRLRKRAVRTSKSTSSIAQLVDVLSDQHDTPQRAVQREEAVRALHVTLAGLPDSQRDAIRLHHLEGMSVEETASALNRTQGAVRGLLQRARLSLRLAMGQSSKWFVCK
jgi:RNA polymerase sigma-70 factor (ECF subfamily)